jgi:PAS domain S-box-containing protein
VPLNYRDLLAEGEGRPGVLHFGGARMAILDIAAGFWGLRSQIEALAGQQLADDALQQAGVNGGASFAAAFAPDVAPGGEEQALRDCIAAYEAAGFGHFQVEALEWPIGRVLVRAWDSFEAWAVGQHGRAAGDPTCAYSAGVLVGFANSLAGRQDIVCIERTCQAQGAESCLFELLPAAEAGQIPAAGPVADPALGRQLNLLEILFDRTPMGIVILGRDLKLRRANPTWAGFVDRYAGRPASQVAPGVSFFDLAPGTEEALLPIFERVLAGETVRQESFPLQTGKGTSYWDAVLSPLLEAGEIVGILHVSIDVTERVLAQRKLEETLETLREREERLSLVMRGTNDGIWDWNLETNEVYFSPRWKSMLGYTEDEIPHRYESWQQLVHPDDLEKALAVIQDHLEGRTSLFELEHRLRHKDGSYRWILARGTSVRDAKGRPYRMVGSHTDITERRQSEAHLRSLLENATDFAVYRVAADPAHPYGGQVVMASPSLQEIVGMPDPYRFESWFENVHPDDRPRIVEANRRAWEAGERYDQAVRVYHPGKQEWVWIHTISTPVFDAQGRLTHFNGLIVDMTEQKQAEEALQTQVAFENLTTMISTEFINLAPDEIDDGIRHALQIIGEFTGVDRTYVFVFSGDKATMSNLYEWCAEGVEPEIEHMQDVPVSAFPWTNGRLMQDEIVHVPQVRELPAEASADRRALQAMGIQSFISVPIARYGSVIGFLGFDSLRAERTWPEASIKLLQIVGEILTNALERKRAQAIQDGQRQFLELLARGSSFSDTLHSLVRLIEEQWPGMLGLILLLDADGMHLHYGAAISLPQEYTASIEGLEIGPLVGSCGTACCLGERVVAEDIATDPRWDGLRDLAVQYGLRACWSQPVLSVDGEVMGTFAMYYRHPRAPTGEELRTIEMAAHLVGIAIENRQARETLQKAHDELEARVEQRTTELRRANALLQQEIDQRLQAEEALRKSEVKYRELVENANSIILQMDAEGRITFFNRFAQEFFGYQEQEILGRSAVGTIVPATDATGYDLKAKIRDVLQHPERYYSSENENMRRDGERVWVAWTNRAIYDPDGRLSEILSIGIDRTEQRRAQEALEEQAKERAIAAERSRLARDLHDAVTQTLFSASLIAEVLPRIWERKPEEGTRRLGELRELTRGALAEMRTLLLELRPTALAEAQVGDLLRQLGESVTGRARVPVTVAADDTCEVPLEVKVALYRIAQEALNNVAKHAGASQAQVRLHCDPARVEMCITDDGCGFDVAAVPPDHLGLGIMRERGEAAGATVQIRSQIGQGTEVRVVWARGGA